MRIDTFIWDFQDIRDRVWKGLHFAPAPGMAQLRQLGCDAFVEIGPQPVLVKHLGYLGSAR